jgi:hypothetical protein
MITDLYRIVLVSIMLEMRRRTHALIGKAMTIRAVPNIPVLLN